MVGHCGIGSWSRNSKIVLASADNITATFAVEKDLWPVFSHEPTATRAPTGEYVVYFTTTAYGCGKDVPHCVPKCYCPNEQEHGCNPGGPTCFSECTGGITAPSCYDIDEDHRGRSAIRSVLAKNSALFLSMPWAMALPLLSNAIPFGSFPFYSWFLLLSITNIAKHQQCMLTCTCTLDARKSLARPSNTPHPNSTDFQRTWHGRIHRKGKPNTRNRRLPPRCPGAWMGCFVEAGAAEATHQCPLGAAARDFC